MKSTVKSFFLLVLSFLAFSSNCQDLPEHPRIIIDPADFKASLEDQERTAELFQLFKETCDEILTLDSPPLIKTGRRILGVSRTYLKRISYLSFAYRITGKAGYLKIAEELMLKAADFPSWNPDHFLDVAEMTMALAIGYDWLYNDLSVESKKLICDAIIRKGLEPSFEYTYWVDATHNWNQVCHASMAFGAWAIFETNPRLAKRIIKRTKGKIQLPMEEYEPDGAYPEGAGYWNYGTVFNVLFLDAWGSIYKKDFPVRSNSGFMKSAEYLLHVSGPAGYYNYSDGGLRKGLSTPAFWFAKKTGDPELLYYQNKFIDEFISEKDGIKAHGLGNRLFPFLLIWLSQVGDVSGITPHELCWTGHGVNPVSTFRTSWDDNAIFVGIKGGSPSLNHAHMDAGSFVMDALGERWVMDLGGHGYHKLESAGMNIWDKSPEGDRWKIFRYTNFSHSTLVFDDNFQDISESADIINSYCKHKKKGATVDLSRIYSSSTSKVVRDVSIVNDKYVRIVDTIVNNQSASGMRWAVLTVDDIEIISNHQAVITINGKTCTLEVKSPVKDVKLETFSTQPSDPREDRNPDTAMLGFDCQLEVGEEVVFEVVMKPGK